MNDFCLEFIRGIEHGKVCDEETKVKFTVSLAECLSEGYYLAFGNKTGWKLTNKHPEKRIQQQKQMATMVNTLFQKQ